jgi:hemoglobin/transferrin/lactoferrin receptor protein
MLSGADIGGTVVDSTGAGVPGVQVRLTTAASVAAGSAESDFGGRFRLSDVAPGAYVLWASKAGFSETRVGVRVRAAENNEEVRVPMDVSPMASALTVSAEANGAVSVDSAAQPVTVIGREEVQQRGTVLSDAAEGQAGVQQLRTSPTLGAFFVRGLTGNKVAVFRDGIRYTTSAQRGGISTFMNLLDPATIDTVEVLRGPNSTQYGSDSLGGTVAVVTRPVRVGEVRSSWHGEVAPFYESAANAFGSSAGVDYGGPRFGMRTDLASRRVNTLRTGGGIDSHAAVTRFLGLPSTVFGERLPDTAFTGYGGSMHSQVRLGLNSQVVAHYERSQQDGGKRYDQLLGGDGNWIADLRNLMLDFGYLRYQQFRAGPFDQWSVTGSFNAQREERVNQGGQGNPAGTITHQYEKTAVWGLQFATNKHFREVDWALGGEGYRETIGAPSFTANPVTGAVALVRPRIPDGARYLMHGLYSQGTWQPWAKGRLRLSGGLRFGGVSYRSRASNSPLVSGRPLWPDDSLAATAVTGRVGAAVWAKDWLGAHAHYSRGFRAPNITDLGTVGLQGNGVYEAAYADLSGLQAQVGDRADDKAVTTGTPVQRLRPEYTNNIDGGIRLRRGRLEADFTAFWMEIEDSIVSQTLILPQGAVGLRLGEQAVSRQLGSGAVFVPASTSPVLVRANFSGAGMRGIEHSLSARVFSSWWIRENVSYVYAEATNTGLPPDIEPGVPPLAFNPALRYRPAGRRYWAEVYSRAAGRQERLSSLALSDRRIGNPRTRSSIQSFFNNGARTRGLVANGILLATGETLAQVQSRVLGTADSAPQFTAIPGYGIFGIRGGIQIAESAELLGDMSNIGDQNYRGIGWGVDGAGRGATIRLVWRY